MLHEGEDHLAFWDREAESPLSFYVQIDYWYGVRYDPPFWMLALDDDDLTISTLLAKALYKTLTDSGKIQEKQ